MKSTHILLLIHRGEIGGKANYMYIVLFKDLPTHN